jgi:hypothetical protein
VETFIYVIIGLLLFESAAKVIALSTGTIPPRKPLEMALDVVIAVGLAIWGCVLLAT